MSQTMRTHLLRLLVAPAFAIVAIAGCGAAPDGDGPPLAEAVTAAAPAPLAGVPACTPALRDRAVGPLAVEDVPGTNLVVLRVGDSPLCGGRFDDIVGAGLLPGGVPLDLHLGAASSSDPMPADGDHPADSSDPMPAQGARPRSDSASTITTTTSATTSVYNK